jgi:queuine tRNA-ribosyltransferase
MSHYPNFKFEITKRAKDSKARIGKIHTPHGVIDTPNFIFCATKATLKGLMPRDIKEAGTQFILSNTYHLMLQPGAERVAELGGLHKFMNWDGPMLTDSGGFQIFSLGHGSVADEIKGRRRENRNKSLLKITEEGATFRSHINGSKHLLTPEKSIDVQRKLGADIILVLDECTPFHSDKAYTRRSMEMSHRWGKRSLDEFNRGNTGAQALYGILQGGIHEDLRQESAEFVNDNPFFGNAVGGTLGANKEQMYEVVTYATQHLNQDRPTHLLGIGGLKDIAEGVKMGIDTFDCVHPTRIARHGHALVDGEVDHINLSNSRFKADKAPIDENCPCYTCQNFSQGYLHHLLKAKELLIFQLLTLHNVTFMNRFMAKVRENIENAK